MVRAVYRCWSAASTLEVIGVWATSVKAETLEGNKVAFLHNSDVSLHCRCLGGGPRRGVILRRKLTPQRTRWGRPKAGAGPGVE